jgi:hypothetical protein
VKEELQSIPQILKIKNQCWLFPIFYRFNEKKSKIEKLDSIFI